ncbi:MAG: baseplate J/gp47 family protein [Methylibium sp.]|nr:baseplate J/gp47 family protein [Methylibium sp.]
MLSVDQLRTVPTRTQMLNFCLSKLGTLGFNVTAWQSGSPQRTLLLGISWVASDFAEVAKQIVEVAFNSTSTGAALEELSISRFGNTPKVGVKTLGWYRLTNVGATPHTLAVGQLLFATPNGIEFRLQALPLGATVASGGGTLDVMIEAVKSGIAGNVAANTITQFKTPLAGVTGTNLVKVGTTWYTVSGEDPESDVALRLRNSTRPATQSVERIRDSLVQFALQASDSVRRAEVDDNNPRGEGTADIYIGGDAGPVGADVVALVQDYMAVRFFRTDTYPINETISRVKVASVTGVSVDVTGTVYYASSYQVATVQAGVNAAIAAFMRNTPVGGYPYPAPGNKVPIDELREAIRSVLGVKTVVLSAPAGDTDLTTFQVPILGTTTLTYSPVTT